MYKLNLTEYFLKKFSKLVSRNINLLNEIENYLSCLMDNPRNDSLKSHKVTSLRFGKKWSSSVNGDLRIIWDYNQEELYLIDVLNLDGHSGNK